MAGIQPYRHPQSIKAANNMAASLGLTYAEGTTATSNMASGVRLQIPHPVASIQYAPKRVQPYGSAKMDYFYPQLQIGMTEPVVVTQVLDPHRLFCQLRSLSSEVQRLAESMHHYYQMQKGYVEEGMPPSLVLGQPCASCGTDRRWYRSLLQELFVDRQLAMVIHVDLGKRDIVPLTKLRVLAAEFLRMPVVTFPCTLYGISDGGLGWDPLHLTDLRAMLLGRQVSARIECYNSYEHLYVVTLFGEDGMDLNCAFGMRSQNPKACHFQVPSVTPLLTLPEKIVQKIPSKPSLQTSYLSKFPPVELKTGKFEDAVVEFVIDPFNFWVRLQKYAANHKEMVDGLTALYSQASKLKGIIAKAKPGQLCCTKYQDLYYRAEVISVNDNKVNVYFLDSGILGFVDWSEIRELPTEYTKFPALANKCIIADTYPLEDYWNEEAILAFKVAVTDKKLDIYVVLKDVDEYTIEVRDQSRIEEKCIGKILANAGLARFEELDTVCSLSSDRNVACVEKRELNPNASGYVSKSPENNVSYFCEEASPFEQQLFEPGTTIEVLVSHVEHPGIFWCQNAASKGDLCTLMGAIQNHCMSTDCPYSAGSLACLAKSLRDEIWYRAFIIEIPVNLSKISTVEVEYVDYGNRETVPVENLRALHNEFFNLKAQAFKCSLYNIITPLAGNPFIWDNASTKVFLEFVQKASKWTEFHCIIYATASLDKELFNIVDLYTPFSRVCDTLVKSGYATHLDHTTLAPSVQLHTYYYSMHDIKLGNEEEVYITHVDSSLLFYAQLVRSRNTVDNISSTIKRVMEKTQKMKYSDTSGALCLAKFIDQEWYRGLIQTENRRNKIFFVDYGNTEELANEDIVPIMPSEHELLLVPMQAIKCFMSDIPSDVPEAIASWFEDAVLDKKLKAVIVEKDTVGKLSVELYDGDQQINAILKNKLGLIVKKDKYEHLPAGESKMVKRDDSRKVPDITTNQGRKTSFSVGKNVRSRESDIRSHSERDQEPEPRYRKPTFQYKSVNHDHSSRFQDSNSQRKTEAVRTDPPTQGSFGGHDTKLGSNKTLPQRQSSTFASERQTPAKPPMVMLTDIPKRKICPGMKVPVYVSHTNSIFDFYVHFADETQLDEVTQILNKEKSSFEVLGDEDINVGNVICAFFPDDGLYYRGVVTEKTRQGFSVEYVDFGNSFTLSDCKNYRLPEKCLHIPIMSIHCSLNKPKNASSAPNLPDLLAEFSKRTIDLQLDCEFLRQDGLKWDVILKDEKGCINDLLTTAREPVLDTDETVMKMKEVETFFVSTYTWNLPEPATIIKVYASSTDGPECFWCQLSTADIDSLTSQVQKAGEDSVKDDNFIDTLQIGNPCNVIFSEDNNWYRAMVTKIEADLVTVRFIDYGNEDIIGRDHVRQLPQSLVKIPPQAFSCCLADFDIKAGNWTPEGRNYFYEKITEDVLELTVCEIQESDLCHIPVAFVTITYDNLNINEEMRKFWQEVPNLDLELSDKTTNLSPVDLLEANPHIDKPTRDQRYNDSGKSATKGQRKEDLPLQDLGEEQESEIDVFEGDANEWGCPDIDNYQQFPGLRSFHQQEVTTQSEIIEDIPGDEAAEELEACTEDGTKQQNDTEGVHVPSEDYMEYEDLLTIDNDFTKSEPPPSSDERDEAAFSNIIVTSEVLYEISPGSEVLGIRNVAADDDLGNAGKAAPSAVSQKDETIGDDECVLLNREDIHNMEYIVTNEDVEETGDMVAIVIGEKCEAVMASEDVMGEDIDNKLSTVFSHKDDLVLQDKANEENVESHGGIVMCEDVTNEDDMAMSLGNVDLLVIEDSLESVATTKGKQGPASVSYTSIENKETVSGVVNTEHFGKDLGPNNKVFIHDDDIVYTQQTMGETDISFQEFEDNFVEGLLIDLIEDPVVGDDLELKGSMNHEEPVDLELKGSVNLEELIDLVDRDSMNHEELVDLEGKDSMNLEELIDLIDRDSMNHEEPVDLEGKGSMNHEELVDLVDKDSMNHEQPVDLEGKDSANLEELIDLVDRDSMNHEELVDLEGKGSMNLVEPVDLELKDNMNLEELIDLMNRDSMNNEEPVDLELKNSMNLEELVDLVVNDSWNHDLVDKDSINLEGPVDLEVKDSTNHEPVDLVVKVHRNLEEPVDLELKDSMNHEEVVDIVVKDSMNHEEVVDLVVKDSMNLEEPVNLKLKDSMNLEELIDLVDRDSMNHEEVVDLVVKDSMNHEEVVDLVVKDSMNHEEVVDIVVKDSMNLEELVDLVVNDSWNYEEAADMESKNSMNHDEAVDINMTCVEPLLLETNDNVKCGKARDINMNIVEAPYLEPKYSMNRIEPIDVELKYSRNCEELVDLKFEDRVKCEAAVDLGLKTSVIREEDIDMELKHSMNHEEAIDLKPKESMNCEEAVAGGDDLKDIINHEEAVDENWELKAVTDEEKTLKDNIQRKEAEVVEVVSFEEFLTCESPSTDFCSYEDPELVQKCVEDKSSQLEAEHLWTISSKDIVQKEPDLLNSDIEYVWVKSTVFGEAIKEDREVASTDGACEEVSISFEEFEATLVEGPLNDLSHDVVASAGQGPEVGEKLELKDDMSHGEAAAKEDIEAEAFEKVFYGSLFVDESNGHEELVQGFVERRQDVVICEFDVGDQSEDADITNIRQQETEQQESDVAEVMDVDVWELTAEDETTESEDNQLGSFTVYRESPALIASTDSVYESELNEPLEETDSDYGVSGPAGSTEDLLWSCWYKPEIAVEETEDMEVSGDFTLPCQTEDNHSEPISGAANAFPQSPIDTSTSVEGELSLVTAAAAEEGCPGGKEL